MMPTVYEDLLPGNPSRLFRRKEDHYVGDIVRSSDAAKCERGQKRLLERRSNPTRLHWSQCKHVDRDPELPEFLRRRAGVAFERVLARTVARL